VTRRLARAWPATYDVEADPWEVDDRAADPSLAAERQRLADLLDRWRAETGDTPR
jgi:arylsulfatase A-like enzyme